MNAKIALIKCENYDFNLVLQKTKEALTLLGGITAFIKTGSRVLVKPNLLMATEPESGIDTHPQVVRAVVKMLKEIDCKVSIGDGPSIWGGHDRHVDEVYQRSGVRRIADEENVELVKFENRRWRGKFPLDTRLDKCDYVVNVPKFKTHELTLLTGAIKNLFGFVSGTFKTELHKNYFDVRQFSKILVDVYQKVSPALTIVDGIIALEGDGPATGGTVRKAGVLVAGSDCVAIDTVLAALMGIRPLEVPTTKEAAERLLGCSDIDAIEIVGDKLKDMMGLPFALPAATFKNKLPPFVVNALKGLLKFYPYPRYENCIHCGACIKICPRKVIAMRKNKIYIEYKRCISCFCCQESCPASAIRIKKSLLVKMLGV